MDKDQSGIDRRRSTRYPIETDAIVQAEKMGEPRTAKTVNVSTGGVLLRPNTKWNLAVGDEVSCDIDLHDDPEKALPFWGVGNVVRVDQDSTAIELKAAAFDRAGDAEASDKSDPQSGSDKPDSSS